MGDTSPQSGLKQYEKVIDKKLGTRWSTLAQDQRLTRSRCAVDILTILVLVSWWLLIGRARHAVALEMDFRAIEFWN